MNKGKMYELMNKNYKEPWLNFTDRFFTLDGLEKELSDKGFCLGYLHETTTGQYLLVTSEKASGIDLVFDRNENEFKLSDECRLMILS